MLFAADAFDLVNGTPDAEFALRAEAALGLAKCRDGLLISIKLSLGVVRGRLEFLAATALDSHGMSVRNCRGSCVD